MGHGQTHESIHPKRIPRKDAKSRSTQRLQGLHRHRRAVPIRVTWSRHRQWRRVSKLSFTCLPKQPREACRDDAITPLSEKRSGPRRAEERHPCETATGLRPTRGVDSRPVRSMLRVAQLLHDNLQADLRLAPIAHQNRNHSSKRPTKSNPNQDGRKASEAA